MAYKKKNLKIKKVSCGGYIVYNETRGTHSHFGRYKQAVHVIKMIQKGILPNNGYYRESCKRLLSGKEYNRLRSNKQKYRNTPVNLRR